MTNFQLVEKPVTEKKATVKRIYVVKDRDGKERLVNTTSPGQAACHVFKPSISVASQQDLVRLRAVEVEESA